MKSRETLIAVALVGGYAALVCAFYFAAKSTGTPKTFSTMPGKLWDDVREAVSKATSREGE